MIRNGTVKFVCNERKNYHTPSKIHFIHVSSSSFYIVPCNVFLHCHNKCILSQTIFAQGKTTVCLYIRTRGYDSLCTYITSGSLYDVGKQRHFF